MQTEEDEAPVLLKKKVDKIHPLSENDSAVCDEEDPKPRIVLTFRSEKSGLKNSNMKIVPNDDKNEEVSPRRSSRTRGKFYWSDDNEASASPKKEKTSQPVSENDGETSDSSHTPKRSNRGRSKDSTDNVLANAIARKEQSFTETGLTQRLSRRIKPTAKILANEELRIGMESQNNARLGITSEKVEEGVRTRRSTRPLPLETEGLQPSTSGKKSDKVEEIVIEDESSQDNSEDQDSVRKLKHLCGLGLKAINTDSMDEDTEDMELEEDEEEDEEDEDVNEEDLEDDDEDEVDDDSEVISKLLEADEDSSEDFSCTVDSSKKKRPRRSTRLCSTFGGQDIETNSPIPDDDDQKEAPRRSSRRSTGINTYESDREYCPPRKRNRSSRHNELHLEMETEEESSRSRRLKNRSVKEDGAQSEVEPEDNNSEAAGAEEGAEAACPEDDDSAIVATCFCEQTSNVYAAPDGLTKPVFCQAIESIDGMRVGCSHTAERDAKGELLPLLRAGPRAPFLLMCRLHRGMLRRHMGCPACGLYCAQGTFSRCSEGHLFHTECAVAGPAGGCAHCGVRARRWLPANCRAARVALRLRAANKRVYLPEQREHCTPAYLSFSGVPSKKPEDSARFNVSLIPEDLLPADPIDLKALYQDDDDMEDITTSALELYEAILAKETIEQLIGRIKSRAVLAEPLAKYGGGTCVHAACVSGHIVALHLLSCAGAPLSIADAAQRLPLLAAVRALLTKFGGKTELKNVGSPENDASDKASQDADGDLVEDKKPSVVDEVKSETDQRGDQLMRENLLKVIRYLIAAGCDVDAQSGEGLTALHMAARGDDAELCGLLVELGAGVDARGQGGWTPLAWAAEHARPPVLRLLLNHGADAASRDLEGNSAIHWCALAGEQRALLMLLEAAPHAIDLGNGNGDTPLHIAARQGHYACVVILLARGASTDIKNSAGELPVEVCSGACHNAILLNVRLAQIAGGKRRKILSNDISNGREQFPVACENEVDDAPPPGDFKYVTQYVMPAPVPIDDTLPTMKGCSCTDGDCSTGACECCVLSVRAWSERGRLAPAFPYHDPPMLFECNQSCACNANKCGNQSVTRMLRGGSLGAPVAVFRTAGRGWGLRAARHVPRGAPLAAYCGELLPLAAADARRVDDYMFSLDVKPDLLEQCSERTVLCVDARAWGSAARFANHSCAANAAPVRVFCGARDLRRPLAVLYASAHIRAGDEITFDYGDKFWSVKSKWMKCECGTPDCRYREKSESDT